MSPRLRHRSWLAGLLLLVFPGTVLAQMENHPVEPIEMRSVRGGVFVDGEYREDTRTRSGRSTTTTDLFLQEGLELQSGGSIYHPNLFRWDGRVRLGLTQHETHTTGGDRSSDGALLGYNLNSLVLPHKPVSLRLFSTYDESRTTRDFAVPIEFERSSNGMELRHRGVLDSSFLFEYTTLDEQSQVRDRDRQTYRARFDTEYRTDDLDLEFRYEHESIDEVLRTTGGSTDLPTESDELGLRNAFRFGAREPRHSLVGHTRYTDRRGFFDLQSVSANQRLNLRHTPAFRTWYTGRYRRTTTDAQDQSAIYGDLGFHQKIYESLDITGSAFIEQEDFNEGDERRYGGELNANYRKRTPIGRYESTFRSGRTYEDEQSQAGQRRIIDEPIVLTGTDFVALSQTNVVRSSIIVRSQDRTIIYMEGVHYEVRVTGPITEIRRIEGAADPIADGETVLIEYTTSLARDAAFTRDRVIWSHRLEIEPVHLSPFIVLEYFDESLRGGDDPGNLDHYTSATLGLEYAHRGTSAGYEYQRMDSDLRLSFQAHRLYTRYNRAIGRDTAFSLGASAEWLTYTDADAFGLDASEDYRTTYRAFARLRHRLNRNTLWHLRTTWRDISGRENTMNAEVASGLEWRWRQLDVSLDGRYRYFEQDRTDGQVASVMFTIRREF
ncbi:MAG: hypothetical protein ACOC9P_00080 [bacterium]